MFSTQTQVRKGTHVYTDTCVLIQKACFEKLAVGQVPPGRPYLSDTLPRSPVPVRHGVGPRGGGRLVRG